MTAKFGLVIDLDRCIGCQTCNIACRVEHGLDSVSGIRVETVGGAHRDTPAGTFPELSMHYLPTPCMHCEAPPCIEACSIGAIEKRPDGIVIVDEARCDGCRECISACPYGAIVWDHDRDKIWKCDLCHERLDDGFEPFCVLCCGVEAMNCGDLNDPDSTISRLIAKRDGYTLQPELGTGPAVYYCPPRPPKRG